MNTETCMSDEKIYLQSVIKSNTIKMFDHIDYCNTIDFPDEINTNDCIDNESTYNIEEKSGDELLIELYRERPFLYDKSNISFKNCLMKQNAWIEISKVMTETNGDMYTPSYCQRRCTSLREQYNRERKKAKTETKSGSAAAKAIRFPFFSQLAFLDRVIKRRRSYTNCVQSQPSIVNEDNDTSESQSINETSDKENEAPKIKKWKVNETKELEQTLIQMSRKISNYMEKKVSNADDIFMEFIKAQFNSIPENEKYIRRKMIMDALTAPLPEK